MPSMSGKVILLTGGDGGIGKQVVSYLVHSSPSEIWITSKNLDNANAAIAQIQEHASGTRLRAVQLDLASFASIKAAASVVLSQIGRLDVLMLHAGVMGTLATLTEDGYEHQFGINYLGHALLTKLLLPVLVDTAEAGSDVRVISTSSYSHRNAPDGGIDFDSLKTDGNDMPTLKRYGQSKLANILFVRMLAEKHPQLTAVAVHPGAARTALFQGATGTTLLDQFVSQYLYRLFMFQPVETVAKHQVWAATTKHGLESGEYYEPFGVKGQGRSEARDHILAQDLWDWTECELESHSI